MSLTLVKRKPLRDGHTRRLRDEVQLKTSYRPDMRVVSMNVEYLYVGG